MLEHSQGRDQAGRSSGNSSQPEKESARIVSRVRDRLRRGEQQSKRPKRNARKSKQKVSAVRPRILIPKKSTRDRAADRSAVTRIKKVYGQSTVMAKVLRARGFSVGRRLDKFLNPNVTRELGDIWQLKDLGPAVEILVDAVKSGKKIMLCSDFDTDGSTAAAILQTYLRKLGGKVRALSPDRGTEGYGLNDRMVHEAARLGYEVLVTLDFGTKNEKEIALAKKLGMKTVVVDHHHAPEGSDHPAHALVNQKQKDCRFKENPCTAGLVYILSRGIREHLLRDRDEKLQKRAEKADPDQLLDIVALGTVADMVPLTGLNRALVSEGLYRMSRTRRPGLRALKEVGGLAGEVRAVDVSFRISPVLMAYSRMVKELRNGKTQGMMMVSLLTASRLKRARQLAQEFKELNYRRREQQRKIEKEVKEQLEARGNLEDAIFVAKESYDGGIVGIVASKLVETYFRPAFVFKHDKDQGTFKGSVRSIPGIHIGQLLETLEKQGLIEKGGGHEMAGGLTLTEAQFPKFKKAALAFIQERLKEIDRVPTIEGDVEVTIAELNEAGPHLINEFRLLEPCGQMNPAPKLLVARARVSDIEVFVDKNGREHTRVWLRQGGDNFIYGIRWFEGDHPALKVGNVVNVVGHVSVNKRRADYNPEKQQLQLEILAVDLAEDTKDSKEITFSPRRRKAA